MNYIQALEFTLNLSDDLFHTNSEFLLLPTNLKKLIAVGSCGIDDDIIKKIDVEVLNVSNNPKVTDVNHMKKLKTLHAFGYCGIDNDGIKNINLKILVADYNLKITSINHMTNLEEFYALGNCRAVPKAHKCNGFGFS